MRLEQGLGIGNQFRYWYQSRNINYVLEIKPCGLGSRIGDMEAEWRLRVITDKTSWWIFGKQNWRWGWTKYWVPKCALRYIWCFWALRASTTLEVKNNHIHVITQDICNKFIEINFCGGCMVSQPNCLFHHLLPCFLLIRTFFKNSRKLSILRSKLINRK